MLATTRSAGVTLEVNLREHVTCTPPPSVNKVAHSGLEIHSRPYQKSKTGTGGPTKRTCVLQKLFLLFLQAKNAWMQNALKEWLLD